MSYLKKYLETFQKNYPNTFSHIDEKFIEPLVCDQFVPLKQEDFEKIQNFISTLFNASRNADYSKNFLQEEKELYQLKVKNQAVLMSYDFHLTSEGPKLIEINTNAAAYLICDLLYQSFSQKTYLPSLIQSFESEFPKKTPTIAIIDEEPKKQPMYFEFLMYKELLASQTKAVYISDYRKLLSDGTLNGKHIDFVYNRQTDFYFKNSPNLKHLYYNLACVFSPQPREYLLLADKQRLIDLSLEKIKVENADNVLSLLLDTSAMQSFDKNELWSQKKKYFFKPRNSFGAKSVYRGKSISQKHFERMYEADSIAQSYAPPMPLVVQNKKMKSDLRAYVYRDKIQMLAGRIYSGQLTNSKDPLGGFARVKII